MISPTTLRQVQPTPIVVELPAAPPLPRPSRRGALWLAIALGLALIGVHHELLQHAAQAAWQSVADASFEFQTWLAVWDHGLRHPLTVAY